MLEILHICRGFFSFLFSVNVLLFFKFVKLFFYALPSTRVGHRNIQCGHVTYNVATDTRLVTFMFLLIWLAWGTFDSESLGQQSQVVDGLLRLGEFLDADPGTHALGVPVPAVDVVNLGHQQQRLVQVPGLEGQKGGKTGYESTGFRE